MIVRGGLAIALGAVSSGVGALIPLLDFGTERESNCKTLLGTPEATPESRPATWHHVA
ncbi:MAG: hypothetical protein IPJ38_04310 [Dechloromonas sp.]|uniref:Uncharacterized protein n=1 Tax=Candidatus Dechloromonas phosphorivorans TaxID=2899244 RepID=A0A935MYD0_9RHOO|nr:hypothetical protein [Candidatus Dechloromonas phosphorivorans]